MSKRSVVTSIAASMVLASVLVLSGCGGSNSSDDKNKAPGATAGSVSNANIDGIVFTPKKTEYNADLKGKSNDGTGKTATLRCADTKDEAGNATCTKVEDQCSVKIKLEASSCGCKKTATGGCVKRVEADKRYTPNYGNAVLDYAYEHRNALDYDPTTDMIVYGGAMVLDINGFNSADIKVDVKGMDCGKAINHKDGTIVGPAGFKNPGHQVFALVKTMDKDGNQIGDDQWTPVDTMDESGNFTIDLNGINLHTADGATKVEVLLFSDKPAKTGTGEPINDTTGISGAGS